MSKEEKMIQRFKTCPKDYTYSELAALLSRFGYEEDNKGNTSGSRVKFYRARDNRIIMLHKPHPSNVMKGYAMKQVLESLIENGDINE